MLLDNNPESLLDRLPVGATYVIEGRGGADGRLRVSSRYVVLPDGHRIDVLADAPAAGRSSTSRRLRNGRKAQRVEARSKSRPPQRHKKIIGQRGTARQQQR